MPKARRGKIAKLDAELRAEVCRRMHDGQSGRDILRWLNALPAVQRMLKREFGGQAVTDQNISEWRSGGYLDWLDQREQVDALKDLSAWARDATGAGTGLPDGAAAIVAGKIITQIEDADDEQLINLTRAIAALRRGDALVARNALEGQRLQALEQNLRLKERQWMMRTAEAVVKYIDSQAARDITRQNIPTEAKTEQLGKLIFGEDW